MNEPEIACPTPEELNELIRSSLPSDRQAELQAHVDQCPACQERLASIVAGSESWDAALDNLRGEVPVTEDTMLSDVVKRMKSDAPGTEKSNSEHLDLLTPSDHPGSIGRLGTYEVSEVIGQGGMGVVLKAFDPSLHRVVAVKVLAPYLAHNPHARKRFVREAQAIAAVSHDHVITIHAIDESEEQPKIVMQYVAGQSLQQKIDAQGSLELKEILRIGMQTASGLAAAHAQGLVHRDVKPSNILLENGVQRVRLTDFGLARAVDDASLTQSGVIAGTPQYMAPEQANGDAVDFRADLFSLGSVIYAMCVGHSPFRASTTMGVLKRVCHDSPRPIQEVNPDIPDWLCNIVMKLLAKKPEDRFSSAKSVAELLEKWLAHVQQPTVVARPRDISIDPGTMSAEVPVRALPAENRLQAAPAGNDGIYARTILFQPVSGRLFLFLTLTGMVLTMASASGKLHEFSMLEILLFSVGGGLVFCMGSLLCISVYRFIHANLSGKPVPTMTDVDAANASKMILAPENIAMLTAIGILVISGSLLAAALAAIVVWRLTKDDPRRSHVATNPEATPSSSADSGKPTNSIAATQAMFARLSENCRLWFRQAVNFVRSIPSLSHFHHSMNWLSVGWFLSAGIDSMGVFMLHDDLALIGVVAILMSLISFAVSHCISVRQNAQFVHTMSFAGLLPVSPGAMVRVPFSLLTLYWLGRPEFKETFDKLPWSETKLGRLFNSVISFIRRTAATILLLSVWSAAYLLIVVLSVMYVVVPYFPAEYHVYDEARATVRGTQPPFKLRLTAIGVGNVYGLQHPASTYRRQSLTIRTQGSAATHQLHILLGTFPLNAETGTEITLKEIENCLSELPEDKLRPTADNLFQTVSNLNLLATLNKLPSSPYRSLGFRERIELFGDALRRGTEPADEEERVHADARMFSGDYFVRIQNQIGLPPGFRSIDSMLNSSLLDVTTNPSLTQAGCIIPTASAIMDSLICILVWFGVCVLIVKRRHFGRKTNVVQSTPVAAA